MCKGLHVVKEAKIKRENLKLIYWRIHFGFSDEKLLLTVEIMTLFRMTDLRLNVYWLPMQRIKSTIGLLLA